MWADLGLFNQIRPKNFKTKVGFTVYIKHIILTK